MADQDDADKTEQPTPKRLREAREKGQVPRSRELSAAAVVAAAGLAMYWGVGGLGERALAWLRDIAAGRACLLADAVHTPPQRVRTGQARSGFDWLRY